MEVNSSWMGPALVAFTVLVAFRYSRLLGNLTGAAFYRPFPIPAHPAITCRDCTVIMPIVDLGNPHLEQCIRSILRNRIQALFLVTVGTQYRNRLHDLISELRFEFPNTVIHVGALPKANKRSQIAHAIPQVTTGITILSDDCVFWPNRFLTAALAPFTDSHVGGVGTNKRIRRDATGFGWESFWGFLESVYFEALNYETRATNAIDGSVSVIGGQTALYRTNIVQTPEFLDAFQNEYFFFGKCGPIAAGDDNFITRWLFQHDWRIGIQSTGNACVEIPTSTASQFISHCDRRSRNSWRSDVTMLFCTPKLWKHYSWGTYAIHLSNLFNFPLFYDAALIISFAFTGYGTEMPWLFAVLVTGIFLTKLAKAVPVLLQSPMDVVFIPGLIIFDYLLTFLKLKTLFTSCNKHWGGRRVADLEDGPRDEIGWIWGDGHGMWVLLS
ncbi:hypothetical protein G7Z17_g7029 [Cylindrodendrum hubeiense]|uniref:Polysaccharide synthase n=1 Tax=Cylindrodendrum hubeiense TaxID=595255 RepID=A0A9P5HB72_9HYPO|nr:hypothetical protein G7Z17_g7029 [Cylindrodendrum hubeiense]